VGEFRLNQDGWFNYFGFPDEPFGTPFKFSHTGTSVKALTYGNLGTGGLSKATFEQSEEFGFVPGFGTHSVEHRAIDAAGNVGDAEEFRATVLPGGSPDCTTTITGTRRDDLIVAEGVTCLEDAQLRGDVDVLAGASLVASDTLIRGDLTTATAEAVQIFGTEIMGDSQLTGTATDVTIAGSTFAGDLTLTDNNQVSANELFGEYGPILAGSRVGGRLSCSGNSSDPSDFGAQNEISGAKLGQCAGL
jgi:hypothetical protein